MASQHTVQVGGVRSELTLDLAGLAPLIERARQLALAQVKAVGESWSDQVTEWMVENAPWNDDTGDARGSLGVVPEYTPNVYTYSVTGGVTYQQHLELARAGKYEIIKPAVDFWGQVLLDWAGAERL